MIEAAALPEHVFFVFRNLREANLREMRAARPDGGPDQWAVEMLALAPQAIALRVLMRDDGTPAALVGAWLERPGVAMVQLLATPLWGAVAPGALRWLKRAFIPCVLAPHVRMARTEVLTDGPDRAWLRWLGFRESNIARPLGANGEWFSEVVWIRPAA